MIEPIGDALCQIAGAGRSLIDEVFHRPDPSGRASPRKARRRGLRRTSSALTTTILGAVIMASTVSAQQFLPSASSRRGSAAASASASESSPAPDSATVPVPPAGSKADPIFGMAASRGARYLLRNGLDYLNYQEYERALKYFREAEIRQKELNEAERLSLKQGIERAQRGLREAVGSETPYALSKRSRRAGGFAAAKPDRKSPPPGPQPSSGRPAPANQARTPSREGVRPGSAHSPCRCGGAHSAAVPLRQLILRRIRTLAQLRPKRVNRWPSPRISQLSCRTLRSCPNHLRNPISTGAGAKPTHRSPRPLLRLALCLATFRHWPMAYRALPPRCLQGDRSGPQAIPIAPAQLSSPKAERNPHSTPAAAAAQRA